MSTKILSRRLYGINKQQKLVQYLLNRLRKHSYTTAASTSSDSRKKLSYRNSEVGDLRLIGATVYDRVELAAEQRPNETAFKFCLTQESFTFSDLKQRIDEIAQNLLKYGYRRGDRLAVMLPNTPEYALTVLAASSIGVTSVLLNPAYQLVEIEFMLKKTKCKGVVILDNLKTLNHYDILTKICPELLTSSGELRAKQLPDLRHVILVHNKLTKESSAFGNKGTLPFENFKQSNTAKIERPYVDMGDDFALLFTVKIFLNKAIL